MKSSIHLSETVRLAFTTEGPDIAATVTMFTGDQELSYTSRLKPDIASLLSVTLAQHSTVADEHDARLKAEYPGCPRVAIGRPVCSRPCSATACKEAPIARRWTPAEINALGQLISTPAPSGSLSGLTDLAAQTIVAAHERPDAEGKPL